MVATVGWAIQRSSRHLRSRDVCLRCQASTEDKNGAWELGVPGVVINIFGNVEVYGPERRQGGYTGNPGFPNERPLIDLGAPHWGPH